MLFYIEGDIFKSPAKVLVNTVNTVGVMGKGIARCFKLYYPDMFTQYQRYCENGSFDIGKLWLYKNGSKSVLNFPTKKDWKQPSKPEFIQRGLEKFVQTYTDRGITSIAFPHLGCGNGELDWDKVVHPLMKKYLQNLPIDIFIYSYPEDLQTPEHKDIRTMQAWLRSDPQTLGFVEFWSDIRLLTNKGRLIKVDSQGGNVVFSQTNKPAEGIVISKLPTNVLEKINRKLHSLLALCRITNSKDLFIEKQAFQVLWSSIRAKGYCIAELMPPGLDEIPDYIIALIAELDFMDPMMLKNTDGSEVVGLQFFKPREDNAAETDESVQLARAV